jgi:hypothetical protein
VRAAATRLAAAVDKRTLVEGLARQLREYFSQVRVADDLSNFKKGDADLILVFDLTFGHRLGEMLKQRDAESDSSLWDRMVALALPVPALLVGASHFLLNNELELVRATFALPQRLTMRPLSEGTYNDAEPAKARDARMVDGLNALTTGLQKAAGAEAFAKIVDASPWACKSVICPLLLDLRAEPDKPQN